MMNLKRNFLLIALMLFISTCLSLQVEAQSKKSKQKKTQNPNEIVVAKVGAEEIKWGTIEHAFQKNLNRKNTGLASVPKDSIMDFIKLYINYRLKVHDAINRGFDNDSSVLADIKQHRKILAESFYYDKVIVEPNVDELMNFRHWDLKFAYILLTFGSPQGNTDTTEVYKRAMEALNKLKAGTNFSQIAFEYSDDKETGEKGGIVANYITGGRLQRPIERALFAIKNEGDIYPELVKTKFGYFILKLLKKEPRQYVSVSHLLLNYGTDTSAVRAKADSLLMAIRKGADFKTMVELHSEDVQTAIKGGSFGAPYSRSTGFEGTTPSKIAEEVEFAMFSLKDGEVSNVIQSEFGFHIIKRDSSKSPDTAKERDDLKKQYKRLYFEEDKQAYIETLKLNSGFEIIEQTMASFLSSVDTTKTNLDSAWKNNITDGMKASPFFKYLNKTVTLADFISKYESQSEYRGMPLNREGLKRAISKMTTPEIFENATMNIESKYSDFANLMREFRDGILLFKVEAIEVWDKLKFDSTRARAYWDSTKSRYMTEPSYDLHEIYVLNDSLANDIYNKLSNGADFEELAASNTQRSGFRDKKGYWGKVNIKSSSIAKHVYDSGWLKSGLMKPIQFEKGFSIIKVNSYEPVRRKTFEEAIPDFAPQYQDLLQKSLTESWLNNVKKKHPVKIFEDKIQTLIN